MKSLSLKARSLLLALFSTFAINSFAQTTIYSESFTSGSGGWTVTSTGSGTGAWVRSTNSSHSSGATGNYFYSQKYSSQYNNNTYITATSPAIDLTGYNTTTFEFKIWHETEATYDGMKIEYSLNNGSSWSDLGSVSSNWYNDSGVDAFNSNEDGWSGSSSGWITKIIILNTEDIGFNSATQAKFRFLFATDNSITNTGVAFDEIIIKGYNGYCLSTGNTSYRTGTRQVIFNTINTSSPTEFNAYSDYTSTSTEVTQGTSYNLTVKVNTDGNYRTYTNAWIDWNQDSDFDDAGESFYLGIAENINNENTSLSPLSITIPSTATLGTTRMRVSTKYNYSPSSCETGFDGEVEDYSINVIAATPTITTSTISPNAYCSGSSISVPYTITGTFTSGNVFTAQLSNATGSFSSPISIGTLTSTTAGTISGTIPVSTTTGTGYRIRVVSSNPLATVTDNGNNITINTIPSPPTVSTITQPSCSVSTGSFILNNLPTGTWTLTRNDGIKTTGTGTSKTITGLNPGNYTYTVTAEDTSTSCPGSGTGLLAEYFNNTTLTAPAALTRTDATVNNDWGGGNPGSPINNDHFSVRWTGKIQPCYTENYTFSTLSDDGIRLWVNGNRIINNWTDHAITTNNSTSVSLTAGTKYDIVLEYYENGGLAVSQLYWSSPSQSKQIIPQSQLYSEATGCTSTTSANIVINTQPAIPTITSTTGASRCGTGSVTLQAATSVGSVNWYTSSTGGSSIHTGTSYNIPNISSTTTYWVEAINSGCTSATRTAVTATINIIPTISGTTPASRCGKGSVTLDATSSAGTINWYENETGGASIHVGTSYTTPSISSTTSYWVEATNSTCTSTRTEIIATINKNYWTGDVDSNWNNAANWCAGVPTNGIEPTLYALIPSGLTNYPVISKTDTPGYVKTIELQNNTTLIIIDNYLRVTENLILNGNIDLEGDAQLLQDSGSTLDPTSSGTLEIDQQGTADTYTYNYWSSPVGKSNSSTNNNSYKVTDVFKNVTFLTSGYNGKASPLSLADYWIWKFSNQLSGNYASWQHVRSTGTLAAGEGFSMKGPGSGSISASQNYEMLGKPNNGNIDLTITAGNDYLVGNPYPCALDATQFILDNGTTIDGPGSTTGTLYFWEHWGGGSHNLRDYQGGYATYSLSGGVPAVSMGTSAAGVATGGTPTKTPGRYIPVAQGFFVTAEATGTIKFNNGQRVFQKEDGTNSVFMKSDNTKKTASSTNGNDDTREKIRLGFQSVNTIRRQLLTTVDANASIGYDWGYDAPHIDEQIDDMYWLIDNSKYVIQGINTITEKTILPLGIHTKTKGLNSITIDAIENSPSSIKIYLHDKQLNVYHNLQESNYQVYLEAGSYLSRFEITFSNAQTLGLENQSIADATLEVYFTNEDKNIVIQNPHSKNIKTTEMFNMLGQSVLKIETNSNKSIITQKTKYLSAGTYIIKLKTDTGIVSKKVLIE
ncbi:putative secreted protein (Por secretion system target) [Mariniflexile fucanivorans]|uniref:Putative secreted protein (Por secretion system target) n=1 Tax=Mariniflexile fucanivorans TaxID=264023 RepID=A0A4R1REE6_9FLAO|nr:PA14 domain-containing protein [Mariniflexile fucanivorans]TCL64000.1 putative secreted protein (Por secretion system target) [Mariniflexile fucanivorans]